MCKRLRGAKRFAIHCWADETAEIAPARRYGELCETDWQGGSVIVGEVTRAFAGMRLGLPKPTDTTVYNKMIPFFSIFLDGKFSSAHDGTELNQVTQNS